MILGLSSAIDLVNWFVVNHHRQVASFASRIAAEMGFSDEDKSTIAIASAIHDIGAISFNERFSLAFDADGMTKHAELGYHLLKDFKPFMRAAHLIRYHHLPWDRGQGSEHQGRTVPRGSHVIHLADRVAVLIRKEESVLKQAKSICQKIRQESDKMFVPEVVDAFLHLADREFFWLDATHTSSNFGIEHSSTTAWNIELDMTQLLQLSELFRMIIDFRSPLTASHSKDVAHLSAAMARLVGFSELEAVQFRIAGNFHDLGKLGVPVELIEKNGPLSQDEQYVMRSHPFHTHRILDRIGGMDDIAVWASLHHECLDGTGYPFRYQECELPLGSRIVAVADIFSALTEDRSYRKSMDKGAVLAIMQRMRDEKKLDPTIVSLVERNFLDLLDVKAASNDDAWREFHDIKQEAETGDRMSVG